jgi:hypothetical protein
MQQLFKECERFEDLFPFKKLSIEQFHEIILQTKQSEDFVYLKFLMAKLRVGDWDLLRDPNSNIYHLMTLPEFSYNDQPTGKIDKVTICCAALLWCKDDDYQNSNKHNLFKFLSREVSIRFIIEKMVRISTILVYGRLKDFNISGNQFFFDQELVMLNEKIKDLVEMIY